MLIVRMSVKKHSSVCGLNLYNSIFIRVNKDYYTPFWYLPKVRDSNCYLDECMLGFCDGFLDYYDSNLKDSIEEFKFVLNSNYPNERIGEFVRDLFSMKLLGLSNSEIVRLINNKKLLVTLKVFDQALNNFSQKFWFDEFINTVRQIKSEKYSGVLKYDMSAVVPLLFSSNVFTVVTRLLSFNYMIIRAGDYLIPYSLSYSESSKGGVGSVKKNNHVLRVVRSGCCDDFEFHPYLVDGVDLTKIIFKNAVEIIFKGGRLKVFLVDYNYSEKRFNGKSLLIDEKL